MVNSNLSEMIAAKERENNALFFHLLVAIICALGGIVWEYSFGNSVTSSLIAWVILLFTFYRILVLNTFFFCLIFLFLYGFWGVSTSLLLIESGGYMSEIREYGYPIGATMKFAFYILLFIFGAFCCFYFFFNRVVYKNEGRSQFKNSGIIIFLFYALLVFILLFLNTVVLLYGSPLSLGIDRTFFWRNIAPPGTEYLHNTLPQFSFISGLIYTQQLSKRTKKTILILFFITLITEFFQGEKFSKLFMTTYFFWLPTLLIKFQFVNLRLSLKTIVLTAFTILFFLTTVFINYTYLKGSYELAMLAFQERLTLQGQVWWAVDRHVTLAVKGFDYFYHQVLGLGDVVFEQVGLYYLMHLISPVRAIEYIDGGANFTAGYPSILVLGTGYILGAPAVFACGVLIGIVVFLLSEYVKMKNAIVALLAVKLFFACYIMFMMGGMNLIATPKFYLFLIGTLVFYYVKFNDSFNTKNPLK